MFNYWLSFVFIGLKYVDYIIHTCKMDEFFTLYVHHGGHYSENPKECVGGDVGVVDDCDPNKLYKVEIESICKDFGFTSISRLWYKMPGDKKEGRMFNLINDDHDEIFMTILVRSHGQIHVYVETPINESILINGGNGVTLDLVVEPEDGEPLDVSDPDGYTSSEPKPAYDGYYDIFVVMILMMMMSSMMVMMILMVISTSMRVIGMIEMVGMVVLMMRVVGMVVMIRVV